MNKKYELLKDDTIEVEGRTLYRIRALNKFKLYPLLEVLPVELGGYIENEDNLSHDGTCWVGENAKAYGSAIIFDHAHVGGNSVIKDNASIFELACTGGNTVISGASVIRGLSTIDDNAEINGDVEISGLACIEGNTKISGNGFICGESFVTGDTKIDGHYELYDGYYFNSEINGKSVCVIGPARIFNGAKLTGEVKVRGGAFINFEISGMHDHVTYHDPIRTDIVITAATRKDIWNILDKSGTAEEFIKHGYSLSEEIGNSYKDLVEFHKSMSEKYWS